MKSQQKGFTLIELIVVIVILGVLAATALPRFIDLNVDARNAAANGVAGSIASGTAINFAARAANNANAIVLNQAEVCTGAILDDFISGVTLVTDPTVPNGDREFQIGGNGDCSGANVTVTCTVTASGNGVAAQPATVSCAR